MSDWQPIETAPKGVFLLVWEPDETEPKTGSIWLAAFDGAQWVEDGTEHVIDRPTHWMPLPEPPPGYLTGAKWLEQHPFTDEERAVVEMLMRDVVGEKIN